MVNDISVLNQIVLFEDKVNCCGCGACENSCPKQAIHMQADEYGFNYPIIDYDLCVACGVCKKVCAYQNTLDMHSVQDVFVSASRDKSLMKQSASGGLFATMARLCLDKGGVVFGATFVKQGNALKAEHIKIESISEIYRLQGSKYVQSFIGHCYKEAEQILKQGRPVLFSGTPCQIAGLKSYLKTEYELLVTIDIICHGVPSQQLFDDYIQLLMDKKKGQIQNFFFRDKTKGWGLTSHLIYQDSKGKERHQLIPFQCSSYYSMFIKGEIYRENCYQCPYATNLRIGDLTLGDYWGIQKEHPELMKDKGGVYSEEEGISCVLVNTDKGQAFLNEIKLFVCLHQSSYEKVSRQNLQLKQPSDEPLSRKRILDNYRNHGYIQLEKSFNQANNLKKHYYYLKSRMPRWLKRKIKLLLGK